MKKSRALLILLLTCALIVMPISADSQNTTTPTTILTTEQTPIPTISPASTSPVIPATTAPAGTENVTTTAPTENATPNATAVSTETTNTTPVTTVTTLAPVITSPNQGTGNLSVASSPLGASILIDEVYYGNTPANITGIGEGNHIIRLTLSGYYDYEGTIYVVPGQTIPVFGTLPPLRSGYSAQPARTIMSTSPVITPVPAVTMQATSSGGLLENPTVIAAIIGTITAAIGAVAAIFPHIAKGKKG